jgi:lipoprotein-releasing system permease protein
MGERTWRVGSVGLLVFLARGGLARSRLSTALLFTAVAAGVGFQVPNTANMLGYQRALLDEGITHGNGEVRLRPREGARFEDAEAIAERLARHPGVRAAVPIIVLPGAVRESAHLAGAPILGVDASEPFLPLRMIAGQPPGRSDRSGLVLGSAIARRLGVQVGDSVQLRVLLASGPTLLPDEDVGRYRMEVRGICGGTWGAYESVFVDRHFLAEELGAPHAGSMIFVYTGDPLGADALAARLAPELPEAQVLAWRDDSGYLNSAFGAAAAVGAVSQSIVVLAVVIPVLALLTIDVLGRRREVGLLGAIGLSQGGIFIVFLLQALAVGVAGVAGGCVIGYAVTRWFLAHPIFEWEGLVIRPALTLECFLRPAAVVLGATLAAGVYPAWRAARTDPARALRASG